MGWTKKQLIDQAYAELALAGYEFDISPEEQDQALTRLETMIATWEADSIFLSYAFASSPDDADPDVDSGIPMSAVRAVILGLAIDLAASFGKTLAPATLANFNRSYALLKRAAAMPPQQQLRAGTPGGAGNKPWRYRTDPFLPRPSYSPLQTSQGGDLNLQEE